MHERNTKKLHVQVILRMNTWLFVTCRRQYNWFTSLLKKHAFRWFLAHAMFIHVNVKACGGFVFSLQHASDEPMCLIKLQRNDRNAANVAKEKQKNIISSLYFSTPHCGVKINYLKSLQITATVSSLIYYWNPLSLSTVEKLHWVFIQRAFYSILNEFKFSSTDFWKCSQYKIVWKSE